MTVAVIVPVHGNQATLGPLAARVAAALDPAPWRLRLVIDASPDASLEVARGLSAADDRIDVTVLAANVGQHEALRRGLRAESDPATQAWILLDADLQDPPEAVPRLLSRLATADVSAVFAGRRGRYQGPARMLTGRLHRAVLGHLTGLPDDAGAFVALSADARQAVLALGGPSVVGALGVSRLPLTSVPVRRDVRPAGTGRSSWSARRRLVRSLHTLVWAARWRLKRQVLPAGWPGPGASEA
jgi:glycosyltransferase involved in cell wall biosynthesis